MHICIFNAENSSVLTSSAYNILFALIKNQNAFMTTASGKESITTTTNAIGNTARHNAKKWEDKAINVRNEENVKNEKQTSK